MEFMRACGLVSSRYGRRKLDELEVTYWYRGGNSISFVVILKPKYLLCFVSLKDFSEFELTRSIVSGFATICNHFKPVGIFRILTRGCCCNRKCVGEQHEPLFASLGIPVDISWPFLIDSVCLSSAFLLQAANVDVQKA